MTKARLLLGMQALLLLDADSDQKLDRAEFAYFVNLFCEACGTDFNTLSEFLILLAALEDNPSEELAFLVRGLWLLTSGRMGREREKYPGRRSDTKHQS